MEIIRRGTSEIIPEEELIKKLQQSIESGKPLNIKLGCDPTRPDLHLGHSVVLRKLAQFQELGHQAILIIGDFTALIGDPSGRNSTRPPLTETEISENAKSYFEQAYKILDKEKTRIVYNSEWLGKMNFSDVIKLASKYTVARMMERDDFTNRFKEGVPISMHEILYPLAQAMDSVDIESDVELGGTDQKFNLLVGRDIQREYGKAPQVILTMPILVGTDGVEKMSKSYDNYIGISDSPKDIYGRTLSIPDKVIYNYYEVATDISSDELVEVKEILENGSGNPRDIKRTLARKLVEMYHSKEAAIQAEKEFDNIFINKGIPDHLPTYHSNVYKINIIELIITLKFAPSKGEARRLIQQGGVSIDSKKITNVFQEIIIDSEKVLKVGKRNFMKLLYSKEKIRTKFKITGLFYENNNYQFRKYLDIKRNDSNNNILPDLQVIVLRPDSSTPLHENWNSEIETETTRSTMHDQIIKVMMNCNLTYSRILTLSDYKVDSISSFFSQIINLDNIGIKHSIFDSSRVNEFNKFFIKNIPTIFAWGVDSKINNLARKAINRIGVTETLGWEKEGLVYSYYHPNYRKNEWVNKIAKMINSINNI